MDSGGSVYTGVADGVDQQGTILGATNVEATRACTYYNAGTRYYKCATRVYYRDLPTILTRWTATLITS